MLKRIQKLPVFSHFRKSQQVKFATKYLKSTARQNLIRFSCYFHWKTPFLQYFLVYSKIKNPPECCYTVSKLTFSLPLDPKFSSTAWPSRPPLAHLRSPQPLLSTTGEIFARRSEDGWWPAKRCGVDRRGGLDGRAANSGAQWSRCCRGHRYSADMKTLLLLAGDLKSG